jgi:regulatory protein
MSMINSALHQLSQKTYSEGELREVLETKYNDLPNLDKILTETLNYIGRYNLVDDERLAHNIARHYAHKGDQFIRNTLKQRKIKSEQIKAALMNIPEEYSRASEETTKRLNNVLIQSCSPKEQANVIRRFLSGRQFNSLTIKNIINQMNLSTIYKSREINPPYCSIAS